MFSVHIYSSLIFFFNISFLIKKSEKRNHVQETTKSNHVLREIEKRQAERKVDQHVEEQFGSGRLLACISSRPGQCGRADG